MSKTSRPGYEARPLPPARALDDFNSRNTETKINYRDGLITEGEAIATAVNDALVARAQYSDSLSACIRWCLQEKRAVGMMPDRDGFARLWDEVYNQEEEL